MRSVAGDAGWRERIVGKGREQVGFPLRGLGVQGPVLQFEDLDFAFLRSGVERYVGEVGEQRFGGGEGGWNGDG